MWKILALILHALWVKPLCSISDTHFIIKNYYLWLLESCDTVMWPAPDKCSLTVLSFVSNVGWLFSSSDEQELPPQTWQHQRSYPYWWHSNWRERNATEVSSNWTFSVTDPNHRSRCRDAPSLLSVSHSPYAGHSLQPCVCGGAQWYWCQDGGVLFQYGHQLLTRTNLFVYVEIFISLILRPIPVCFNVSHSRFLHGKLWEASCRDQTAN